ncbi:transposase [Desulfobacula sp.]|uniref:transposase n=1 Tax=Desulfobacula sp. TaxID=2593537 RepID=UPI0025BD8C7C|nr:transposase [Desulfobacula sp.]
MKFFHMLLMFTCDLKVMLEDLEEAFQYEVLKMLKKEGKINDAIIENMLSWYHSGFHVYIGDRIYPQDTTGLGNLARYIVRACFSQERMIYVPVEESTDGVAKVIYTSKDRKSRKVFKFLTFRLCSGLACSKSAGI